MERRVTRIVGIAVVALLALLVLAGCGGQTTPDTEGQTLAQAQQELRNAGVAEGDITVTGETGDPNNLTVCDHDPDGVAPTQPVTLQVAQNCQAEEEDDDRKRKKRSGGNRRR
jgi:hypothetical protein